MKGARCGLRCEVTARVRITACDAPCHLKAHKLRSRLRIGLGLVAVGSAMATLDKQVVGFVVCLDLAIATQA